MGAQAAGGLGKSGWALAMVPNARRRGAIPYEPTVRTALAPRGDSECGLTPDSGRQRKGALRLNSGVARQLLHN